MQTVVMRSGKRGILAVVTITRIWATTVVSACRGAAGHILIHGNNKMQPAHMLVTGAQRGPLPQLPLDLETALLGVCVLHVRIHGAEVEQYARWNNSAGENTGKRGRARLGG